MQVCYSRPPLGTPCILANTGILWCLAGGQPILSHPPATTDSGDRPVRNGVLRLPPLRAHSVHEACLIEMPSSIRPPASVVTELECHAGMYL